MHLEYAPRALALEPNATGRVPSPGASSPRSPTERLSGRLFVQQPRPATCTHIKATRMRVLIHDGARASIVELYRFTHLTGRVAAHPRCDCDLKRTLTSTSPTARNCPSSVACDYLASCSLDWQETEEAPLCMYMPAHVPADWLLVSTSPARRPPLIAVATRVAQGLVFECARRTRRWRGRAHPVLAVISVRP